MSVRTAVAVIVAMVAGTCGAAAARADTAPDTLEARAQGCSTCHGTHGQGSSDDSFPRIAGKPRGYLFSQLQNFRDGRRSYPPMNYLLAYMQDDYLSELAGYFASQSLTAQVPLGARAGDYAAGEQVVKAGDTARGIPACIACHGPMLTGINPGVPALVGLHSRYVASQLEAWRVGTRHATAPDCMHDIAARLSESEITAVAAWLAAQRPPSPATAAAPGSWKTPLVCGSQP